MSPSFSIIIPTYNRAKRILTTIKSVLNQSFKDFEFIIVDDGSTDNTGELIGAIQDERIKYYHKKNEERAAARNYGILKSSGKYITLLDSDDILYSDFLDEANKFIIKNNSPDLFHMAYEIIETEGQTTDKIIHHRPITQSILHGNSLSCIGVVVKSSVQKKNLFCSNRDLSGSEDWLMWLKLSVRYRFEAHNHISAALIQHPERSVLSFDLQALITRTNILVNELESDEIFVRERGYKVIEKIRAHMYSYIALHAAISIKKGTAIQYLLKAISLNVNELFKRRFLAIVKHLI